MSTIIKTEQANLKNKKVENMAQLKVSDVSEFQLEGGFNELTKRGFYFRRPRFNV